MNKKTCCLCYLAHGTGMAEMFSNSVRSLRQHCADLDVFLYVTAESLPAYAEACSAFNVSTRIVSMHPAAGRLDYSSYGSTTFNSITAYKFVALRELLESGYSLVVYADMDIAFLGDFRRLLLRASAHYSMGMQGTGEQMFPLHCCLGFMYFTQRALPVVKQLEVLVPQHAHKFNDEEVFNQAYKINADLIRDVFVMPEALFPSGNQYSSLFDAKPYPVTARAKPFLFHANYVVGLEGKVSLLKHVGLWNP